MQTETPLYRNKNLLIIYSITLIAVMGVASLTPAFPKIISYFNISTHEVGLLIAVFTLPGVILTPLLGILSDRVGRKNVVVPSLFLFAFAGVACAFIDNFKFLLFVRFIQGVGAASIGALNLTLIGDIFTGPERARAMGYNAGVISIGTALYPAIGGLLAGLAWNYPFLLSLMALPAGLLVLWGLDNQEPEKNDDFKSYFKNAFRQTFKVNVLAIFGVSFLFFTILYGSILTYTPILLKQKFNSQPGQIGLCLSVMSIAMGVAATQTGKLSARLSLSRIVLVACILYIVAFFLIPVLPNIYLFPIPLLIYGFANGMLFPVLQTALAGKASLEERGMLMSLNGMVLRLGQTVGPVIAGLFYMISIEWAFWVSIFAALFIMLLSRWLK